LLAPFPFPEHSGIQWRAHSCGGDHGVHLPECDLGGEGGRCGCMQEYIGVWRCRGVGMWRRGVVYGCGLWVQLCEGERRNEMMYNGYQRTKRASQAKNKKGGTMQPHQYQRMQILSPWNPNVLVWSTHTHTHPPSFPLLPLPKGLLLLQLEL